MINFFEQGPTTEGLSEKALFTERLAAVCKQAKEGSPECPPTAFLAGIEIEFGIAETDISPVIAEAAARIDEPEVGNSLQSSGYVLPTVPLQNLAPEDKEKHISDFRQEALDWLETLQPQNEAEAKRKRHWQKTIPKDITGLINFRLYQEFSKPTLADPKPPVGADYATMQQYGKESGWLEFCFGDGTLQSGYYDNGTTVETRLTPCPPDEAARRQGIILQRLADISAEYGALVVVGGIQLNVSAYQENAQGVAGPVLTTEPDRAAKTLDALAGVTAVVEDGAWIESTKAQALNLFYPGAKSEMFEMGTKRVRLRLQDGYVELRNRGIFTSTEHGLLWLTAGMLHGLRKGWGELAAEGCEVPLITEGHRVERLEGFDKDKHVHLLRAIELAARRDDGGFDMAESYNRERSKQVVAALLDYDSFADPAQAFRSNIAILRNLRADPGGMLHCDQDALTTAFEEAELPIRPDVIQILASRIDHQLSVIRLHEVQTISGTPNLQGLPPAERRQRLLQSEAMRLMYGSYTDAYVESIMKIADHAYSSQTLAEYAFKVFAGGLRV